MPTFRPARAEDALCARLMPPHMATQCRDVSRPSVNSAPSPIPALAVGKRFRTPRSGETVTRKNIAARMAAAASSLTTRFPAGSEDALSFMV